MTKISDFNIKKAVKRWVALGSTVFFVSTGSRMPVKAESVDNEQINKISVTDTINEEETKEVRVLTRDNFWEISDHAYNVLSKRATPNGLNDLDATTYWFHYPNVTKELTDELIEEGYLINDGYHFNNNFEIFTPENIVTMNCRIIDEAKKKKKEITVDDLYNIAEVFGLDDEKQQEERKRLEWLIDIRINGINSEGYNKLYENLYGINPSIESLNELFKSCNMNWDKIYKKLHYVDSDDCYEKWKAYLPYEQFLKDLAFDHITKDYPKKVIERRFRFSQDAHGKGWLYKDDWDQVRLIDDGDDFERAYVLYIYLNDPGFMAVYLDMITFKEGTEDYNNFVNGKYHECDDKNMVILIDGDEEIEIPNALMKEEQKSR